MRDSVFIYAFTRYGWTEECIDIDEVAYVDFEKSQIFGGLSLAWLGGLAVIGVAMWKEGREDDE